MQGGNLHEMSKPIFWGNKNKKDIVNSSAEFVQRVIKFKYQQTILI